MKKIALLSAIAFLCLSSSAQQNTCRAAISFSFMPGTSPYLPGIAHRWVEKNSKKYPDVCFPENHPVVGVPNYLLVFSADQRNFNGLNPVVRTTTATTPVSGNEQVTNQATQETWNVSYSGTITTTTQQTANVPYSETSRSLFVNAYNQSGWLVSSSSAVYSSRTGGDAASTAGYNTGSLLVMLMNSPSRLISRVMVGVIGKPEKKKKHATD